MLFNMKVYLLFRNVTKTKNAKIVDNRYTPEVLIVLKPLNKFVTKYT